MTLSRTSGSKPQRGEDRIGGGPFRLPRDPVLDPGEALGSLMDIVAVGDVGERFEQLLKAFAAAPYRYRGRRNGPASWRAHDRPLSLDVFHPSAFPRNIPAPAQSLPVAG